MAENPFDNADNTSTGPAVSSPPRRKPRTKKPDAAKSGSKKAAQPTRTRSPRQPLPDNLLALIDNYVALKTSDINHVNKGRLTAKVRQVRDDAIKEAVEKVDTDLIETNVGGLLNVGE